MWGIRLDLEPIVQGELEWKGNWLSPEYLVLYPLVPSADATKKITYKKKKNGKVYSIGFTHPVCHLLSRSHIFDCKCKPKSTRVALVISDNSYIKHNVCHVFFTNCVQCSQRHFEVHICYWLKCVLPTPNSSVEPLTVFEDRVFREVIKVIKVGVLIQ